MLIRKSLRKEMEKELEETTKDEIKTELETFILLAKIHTFISRPSGWCEAITKNLWPDTDEHSKRFVTIWNDFGEKEKKQMTALYICSDPKFAVWQSSGSKKVWLGQMMDILHDIKTNELKYFYFLLHSRHFDVRVCIGNLEKRQNQISENLKHLDERMNLSGHKSEQAALLAALGKILGFYAVNYLGYRTRFTMKETFDFVKTGLQELEQTFKEMLKTLPDPGEMPCKKALELALAMHREKRDPKTQEEVAALEHFSYPYSCTRNKACNMLSHPPSDTVGEAEYAYAEEKFRIMQLKK